jgi:hypothetical protein
VTAARPAADVHRRVVGNAQVTRYLSDSINSKKKVGEKQMFNQYRKFKNLTKGFLIGAAVLALASLTPAAAFAQATVTVSPASATNPSNVQHNVTVTIDNLSSTCIEDPASLDGVDGDDVGAACFTNADCGDPDDICDHSGYQVGYAVTAGPNAGFVDSGMNTTDVYGQFTSPYGTLALGTDTIVGCLDFGEFGADDNGSAVMCINDAQSDEVGGDDVVSDPAYKTWVPATFSDQITLSPLSAVNSVGQQHTVTAMIDNVPGTCIDDPALDVPDFDDGDSCNTNADCPDSVAIGGDEICDHSGYLVGFEVTGANPQESNFGADAFGITDVYGKLAFTYSGTKVGTDHIQGCLDADPLSGNDEIPGTVHACIIDSGLEGGDYASEPVSKRWDPIGTLNNRSVDLFTGAVSYTTDPAFNPVGTTHTVQASVVGPHQVCAGGANNYNACIDDSGCTSGDTCQVTLAGYPVFFGILNGPNAGDLPFLPADVTDASGNVSKTYSDAGGVGIDTIQACVDADLEDLGYLPDDSGFTQCLNDYPTTADVPTNTVIKTWLTSFVTGGGKVVINKDWWTFGGVVGQKPGTTSGAVGEWQETHHPAKGGNLSCHWNTFSKLAFSCSAKCTADPASYDTIQFEADNGKCTDGSSRTVLVTIKDGQKKPDTIKVTGDSGTPNLNVTPAQSPLKGGNFTIHK